MRLKATVLLHIPDETNVSHEDLLKIVAKLRDELSMASWESIGAGVCALDFPDEVQDAFRVEVPSITRMHRAGGESSLSFHDNYDGENHG